MTTRREFIDAIQAGDRVYRYVSVGSAGGFDLTEPQPLTVVRVNRVTVTVRTDEGSQFRMDPEDIQGPWTY